VCPIPDACLLVMAQRPYRLLGSLETRSLIFLIKNSPDQVEGYLDYQQPMSRCHATCMAPQGQKLERVNLWFESNNTLLIYPTHTSACSYYLKHVLLVVVTVTLLLCDISISRYVISIKMVMQSCLSASLLVD
jgi:hypothetical protein